MNANGPKQLRGIAAIIAIIGFFIVCGFISTMITLFSEGFDGFPSGFSFVFSFTPFIPFILVFIIIMVSRKKNLNKDNTNNGSNVHIVEENPDPIKARREFYTSYKKGVGIIKNTFYEVEKTTADDHTFENNEIYHYYVEFDYINSQGRNITKKIEVSEDNYDKIRFLRTLPILINGEEVYVDQDELLKK